MSRSVGSRPGTGHHRHHHADTVAIVLETTRLRFGCRTDPRLLASAAPKSSGIISRAAWAVMRRVSRACGVDRIQELEPFQFVGSRINELRREHERNLVSRRAIELEAILKHAEQLTDPNLHPELLHEFTNHGLRCQLAELHVSAKTAVKDESSCRVRSFADEQCAVGRPPNHGERLHRDSRSHADTVRPLITVGVAGLSRVTVGPHCSASWAPTTVIIPGTIGCWLLAPRGYVPVW